MCHLGHLEGEQPDLGIVAEMISKYAPNPIVAAAVTVVPQVFFKCDPGYASFDGDEHIICTSEGTWFHGRDNGIEPELPISRKYSFP